MPIYEYRCKQCDEQFEMIRPMGDTGKGLACPECGARRPEKLPTTFAAHGGSGKSPATGGGCGPGAFT